MHASTRAATVSPRLGTQAGGVPRACSIKRLTATAARPSRAYSSNRSSTLRHHGACHSRWHVRASERDTSGVKSGLPQPYTFLRAPQRRLRTSTVARRGVKRSCKTAPDVLQPCPRDWAHKRGEYPARAQSSGTRSPQHGLRARTGHHQSTHPTTTSECLTGCPRRMTRGDEQHNLRSTGPAATAR